MPSNVLALTFAFVMFGLVWTNNIRETSLRLPLATPGTAIVSRISAVPSPKPVRSPAPLPSPTSIPTPTPVRSSSVSSSSDATLPSLPELNAYAFALADENGALIVGRRAGEFLPIASISKLVTALVLQELFPDDGTLTISEGSLSLNSSGHGIAAGDTFTKREALEILLVASSNVVAQSAAETIGEREFIARMNGVAVELGMAQTIFIDPSGLANFNRSSAKDVVTLLRALARTHPEVLAISRIPRLTLVKPGGKTYSFLNTNELLGRVPGIIGGKTGYTEAADGCLAVVFEWRGRTFYAVVLGSKDRFADMRALIEYAWNL